MSALLPCPFCNAELEDRRISAFAHPKNGCILDGFAMTDPAIPKWNRRTPPPLPSREEVARAICIGMNIHLMCTFPDCGCKSMPDAADAVLRLLGGGMTDA